MKSGHIIRRLRFLLQCMVLIASANIPAGAATNVVTTLADSGPGSLRQAISNALSGDTIIFSTTGTIALTSGELVLTKHLSVLGPGATNLAVSGNGLSRVFNISNSGITVRLSGLTIQHGQSAYVPCCGSYNGGGGLLNLGTLILNSCVIISNRTHHGPNGVPPTSGGISPGEFGGFGAGILNVGTLMLTNCTIAGNQTGNGGNGADGVSDGSAMCGLAGPGGDGGSGGAIYNDRVGPVIMNACIISGNVTGNGGNAGRHAGPLCGGFLGPEGKGGDGAGIWKSSSISGNNHITAIGCLFENNSCGTNGVGGEGYPVEDARGGGIGHYYGANLSLSGCTFIGNAARGNGGAIWADYANIVVSGCTFYGNRATSGGGLWIDDGTNVVSTSTFSGNQGGAICATEFPLAITSSTVVSNNGGGVHIRYRGLVRPGQVLIRNSTIVRNSPYDLSGRFASQGHNFVGTSVGGGFTNSSPSDIISINDPMFGPLADNGGPTLTHALLPGSPALDAGDDTLTGTDQRGRPRLSGAHVDIGAFEFQVPAPQSPGLRRLTNGTSQFSFTTPSDVNFNVLASTNISLPSTQWFNLGPATLITNGLYEFTEPVAASNRHRFFQLRWP